MRPSTCLAYVPRCPCEIPTVDAELVPSKLAAVLYDVSVKVTGGHKL